MKDFIPKRVFTLLDMNPNEEIYEICITLKDIHGAVSETARVLSDAHVNLRTSILFDAVEKNGVGYWTSFVDLSKASTDIREIEEKLRKLDVVQDVEVAKPQPLPYDIIHFPVMHGKSVATIMPVELFGSLFDEIENILTPSGFVAVFYNAGKKSGAFMTRLFEQRYMLKDESLISALFQATKSIGWGQIEDLNINEEGIGKVKIRMCFEALLRGFRKEKVCHWTRGFLAGFLGAVKGKSLEAVELKCIANRDEICEFEIKPSLGVLK
jgi:predicted hydrocarbon binding protein